MSTDQSPKGRSFAATVGALLASARSKVRISLQATATAAAANHESWKIELASSAPDGETDLHSLRAQREAALSEVHAIKNEIAGLRASLAPKQQMIGVFTEALGIKASELDGKDQAALTALLTARRNERIEDLALDQIASMGLPADKLPKNTDRELASQTLAAKNAHLKMLSGAARDEYYNREIAPFFKAGAARKC